jgi:uncharacterized membrane protein YhhN
MLELLFNRGDGLDPWRVAIAALSLATAVAYLGVINDRAGPRRTVAKTAAIAILPALPLTYLAVPGAPVSALVTMTLALVLSALGDYFLALEDQSRFFVPGLASFLAAHVAYIAAFLPYATVASGFAPVAIIAVAMAAGILLGVLRPALGRLRWPVYAYFAVIMTMVAAAMFVKDAPWYLGAGAVIFALSDSLIAVRKFLKPFPGVNEAVWVTYIAAQFMLTAGLLVTLLAAI